MPSPSKQFPSLALLFGAGVSAITFIAGCGAGTEPLPIAPPEPAPAIARPVGRPAPPPDVSAYRIEAERFSPNLGRLLSNGHMVVLPSHAQVVGLEGSEAGDYAFSAADGFARLYHFFQSARWTMAPTVPLVTELPLGGWQIDWSDRSGSLELLVSSPNAESDLVSLYRLVGDRWQPEPTENAPPADPSILSARESSSGAWFVVASDDSLSTSRLWRLDGQIWSPLAPAVVPDVARAQWLIDYPPAPGLSLLTDAGEIWLWSRGVWSHELTVRPATYSIFHYDPSTGRILLGESRGIGRTVLRTIMLARGASQITGDATTLTNSDRIEVNESIQGTWKGAGRVRYELVGETDKVSSFSTDLDATGFPALAVVTQNGTRYLQPSEITRLDLLPQFDSLWTDRGAFVPAVGGFIEVSSRVSGLRVDPVARFPFVGTGDALTTDILALEPRSTLSVRQSRFWRFEGEGVQWLKPYPETHPELDFESYRFNPRTQVLELLSSTDADNGFLQYTYRRQGPSKVQWLDSPLLTLRDLPYVRSRDDAFWLLESVAVGDPPEIFVAGWIGSLGREVVPDDSPADDRLVAYTEVPERGFFARILALSPEAWVSGPLPIRYGVGVQLISDPMHEDLYLLGGRVAVSRRSARGESFHLEPNYEIWHWGGEEWKQIVPAGRGPRFDGDFAAAYDPFEERLLVLTPHTFFSLSEGRWTVLWEASAEEAPALEGLPGLYIHPRSGQILGTLTGSPPTLAVWHGDDWVLAVFGPDEDDALPGFELLSPDGIFPLIGGEAGWALADAATLRALREPVLPENASLNERYAFAFTLVPETAAD